MGRPLSRLRPRLIAAFLLVSLVPLLLLEYFSQRATREALIDSAHQALYAAATQTAAAIDAFLDDNLNALRVEALLPAFASFLARPDEAQSKRAAAQTLLGLSRKDTVNIVSFALLDIHGRNLLDTRTVQIGQDESRRDYFRDLMAARLPTVSAMQFARAPGNALTLHFASLVWDPKGHPQGVLRITYNATVVQQLATQSLRTSPSRRVALLDEHHLRLADSARPDLTFTPVAPLSAALVQRLKAEWRLPEDLPAASATGSPAFESGLRGLEDGGYFTAPVGPGPGAGDPYAVGAARLRFRPWLVVVSEPQSVLLAPIERQLREGILLAVTIALAVSLFGVVMAGGLTWPFRTLTDAVLRFSAGEREVRVNVHSPHEAGELAQAFNRMMDRIRTHTEDLEAQVLERTQALQADIARREAAEQALAQAHVELEHRVEQRTAELRTAHERLRQELADRERAESEKARLEVQLRQAQKMEAIGTLAGGIAHDFNGILGAIMGYAELALDSVPAGSHLARYLGNVMAAGNRAKGLVDQILVFTQPGNREHVAVRLGPLVGEVTELIEASLPTGIDLKLQLTPEDTTVLGDAIRLHQVVMNLCKNAVQAMPAGGLLVVALERLECAESTSQRHHALKAGPYVCLRVMDTGLGMDQATLERIYDPFFTTKEVGRGTGLGLSLVHGIVSEHGGTIEVSSTPGQGSCFSVYLPHSGATAAEVATKPQSLPQGQGQTILLVDDDEPLVLLGEEMIAALGYEPIGFKDSHAALEAFTAHPERYDLVLTDQLMPKMSGTELASRLRALRPDIPILLMSGFGGPELAQKAERAGITCLLKKPLQSRDLAVAIAKGLGDAPEPPLHMSFDGAGPLTP